MLLVKQDMAHCSPVLGEVWLEEEWTEQITQFMHSFTHSNIY